MPRAVILTAIRVEYMAVQAYLKKPQEEVYHGTVYERGNFSANKQVWDVIIAEIGAGNPGAAGQAERAIAYFNPQVILFVGVAGGIKDVRLGDVVASTKVYAYESGKAGETFQPRPEIGLSAYSLEQRARVEAREEDWLKRLPSPPETTPTVFVAPIAAGEKVIASTKSEVFQFLRSNYGDAVAVEMEGIGFLDATHANQQVSAMVIRGISDLIDGKSEVDAQGYQEIAASHASAFAFQVLAKLNVKNDKVDSTHSFSNTESVNSKGIPNYQQTVRPEAERDLLETVRRKADLRLREQLHYHVRLNLTKETQPRQVRPWDMEVKVALPKPSQLLSPEMTIGQVFEHCSGRLLILGEPGAGKTTSLLDLALELAARAEADPQERIPVIVDLSDWQPTVSPSISKGSRVSRKNFSELSSEEKLVESIKNWLINKVSNKYGVVSLQKIQQWLEKKRLVPLLDGLDEVSPEYQQDCVQAINLWLNSKWQPTEVAVCCRREPYESYSEKLKLYGAVYLQDLTDKQIQKFLVDANRGELAESLFADKNLLALIRRPLLLSMAIFAYQKLELIQWQRATSAGDRLDLLLDAYVRHMLDQNKDVQSRFYKKKTKLPTQKQSRKWLEILALELLQDSKTDFWVEQINTKWLSTSLQKRLFTVLAIAAWGLSVVLVCWALVFLVVSSAPYFVYIPVIVLSIALILWILLEWESIYINRRLVLLCLFSTNSIPWNYTCFLNYATERLLLQRTGSSYRFIHDLLRQYLAQSRIDSNLDLISPQVFFRCGNSYGSMEQYDKALQQFNRAIELEPKYFEAIAERGMIYRWMKRYEEALQDFNLALELDPKDDWAITNRGVTYGIMERYEEALQDFNRALELDPKSDEAIAQRGVTYGIMERYEEALQDFNRALELDPKSDEAIANRGTAYMLMERYEEALQDFDRAIELNPKSDEAIAQRGATYILMERYEKALQDFNQAIELNPKSDEVIANRGFTYILMACYEEALKDFNQAIELNPKYDWAIAQRGVTYQRMERYEEALKDFNRAIKIAPKSFEAIANRGVTYQLMELYEEALQDLNQAIEFNPKNDNCLYIRGFTYLILNQTDSAKADLNNAIQIAQNQYAKKPDNCQNKFNLALYHLVAGNLSTAQGLYQAALQQGTSQFLIREAIQNLTDLLRVFPENTVAQEIKATLLELRIEN
ncbi:MAG: tetratricopeptide repeat protein [Symploca sp. SIO2D2]|nr:tetratricopeptide repeat protein [Symploca sp. SIO2D2]